MLHQALGGREISVFAPPQLPSFIATENQLSGFLGKVCLQSNRFPKELGGSREGQGHNCPSASKMVQKPQILRLALVQDGAQCYLCWSLQNNGEGA